jgi:poly(A) polymerase Pap1
MITERKETDGCVRQLAYDIRATVFSRIEDKCRAQTNADDPIYCITTIGSSCFDVDVPGSSFRLVCFGPHFRLRTKFLRGLRKQLENDPETEFVNEVATNTGATMLVFVYTETLVKFRYAHRERIDQEDAALFLVSRTTDWICNEVHDQIARFQLAYRFVKYWIRQRRLNCVGLGFVNGMAWAYWLAQAMTTRPTNDLAKMLQYFFAELAQQTEWTKGVATSATAACLRAEVERARDITATDDSRSLERLLESFDAAHEFSNRICFDVEARTHKDQILWRTHVLHRFVRVIRALEAVPDLYVIRPYMTVVNERASHIVVCVRVLQKREIDLVPYIRPFVIELDEWRAANLPTKAEPRAWLNVKKM